MKLKLLNKIGNYEIQYYCRSSLEVQLEILVRFSRILKDPEKDL